MMRRGFTLLELLAAMAILAVVSVMALQALSGALFQRDILGRTDARAQGAIRALALLRHDFEAALPPLRDPEAEVTPVAGLFMDGAAVTLLRGGMADVDGGAARITWAVSQGTLTRAVQPTPFDETQAEAVTILDGIRDFTVTPLDTVDDEDSAWQLAPGYEITLNSADLGALRLVVAR